MTITARLPYQVTQNVTQYFNDKFRFLAREKTYGIVTYPYPFAVASGEAIQPDQSHASGLLSVVAGELAVNWSPAYVLAPEGFMLRSDASLKIAVNNMKDNIIALYTRFNKTSPGGFDAELRCYSAAEWAALTPSVTAYLIRIGRVNLDGQNVAEAAASDISYTGYRDELDGLVRNPVRGKVDILADVATSDVNYQYGDVITVGSTTENQGPSLAVYDGTNWVLVTDNYVSKDGGTFSGAVTFQNNVNIDGTLDTDGPITAVDIAFSGTLSGVNASFGTLEVTGQSDLKGMTYFGGDETTYKASISNVDGETKTKGSVYTQGSVYIGVDVAFANETIVLNGATGNAVFDGIVTASTGVVAGGLTVTGDAGITGALGVGTTLEVTGAVTANSTLDVTGNVNLAGTKLQVNTSGDVTIPSNLVVNGDGVDTGGGANTLYVGGNAEVTDNLEVGGALVVPAAASIGTVNAGSLAVTGATSTDTIAATTSVTSPTYLTSGPDLIVHEVDLGSARGYSSTLGGFVADTARVTTVNGVQQTVLAPVSLKGVAQMAIVAFALPSYSTIDSLVIICKHPANDGSDHNITFYLEQSSTATDISMNAATPIWSLAYDGGGGNSGESDPLDDTWQQITIAPAGATAVNLRLRIVFNNYDNATDFYQMVAQIRYGMTRSRLY